MSTPITPSSPELGRAIVKTGIAKLKAELDELERAAYRPGFPVISLPAEEAEQPEPAEPADPPKPARRLPAARRTARVPASRRLPAPRTSPAKRTRSSPAQTSGRKVSRSINPPGALLRSIKAILVTEGGPMGPTPIAAKLCEQKYSVGDLDTRTLSFRVSACLRENTNVFKHHGRKTGWSVKKKAGRKATRRPAKQPGTKADEPAGSTKETGVLLRAVTAVLKDERGPLTASEIGSRLHRHRYDAGDADTAVLAARASTCLNQNRDCFVNLGRQTGWTLKENAADAD